MPICFFPIRTRILFSAALMLLASVQAFPQSTAGRILGAVTDQSGAALKDATVVLTDVERGTSRALRTDDAGQYVAPDLAPSTYKVRVEAHGFKTVERSGVELEVAKDVRLDFSLQPGQVTETIQVSAAAPLIDTTSSTLGGTLTNKEINDLPLNGRDFQNLVVLRPGIMRYPGGGIGSVSANGIRPEDNNYIVDGVDNNDSYFGQSVINGSGVQGTPATILPIDAIQEFNVLENPGAEYGWKPGATINVGLKSGTNTLHGTTYYFDRNAALDARNFFNPAPNPKALRLHQFGGTVGGPLIKDKLFFFTAYEGVRSLVGVTNQFSTPATVALPDAGNCTFTTGDCAQSIPDALADLQAGGFPVNPLSQNLQKLFPANAGTNPNGPSTIITDFPNTDRGDNGLAKLDYHLSPSNLFSGTYFIGDSLQNEQDQPVLQPQWLSQATTRGQFVGISWTTIPNSRLVNEARFGYNRLWQTFFTVDGHQDPATAYGINTGVTNPANFGMPTIRIAGFGPPPPAGIFGGNAGWPQLLRPATNVQFVDNVSYTRGAHAFKFGGEIRRSSIDHVKNRLGKGRIDFNGGAAFTTGLGSTSLEDFFAGDPTRGRIAIGDSHRQLSFWSYAGFLRDDWRATPRLTVNLGLRYELNTVIKESHNLLGNFDPTMGVVQVGQQIKTPYNGDHNNFAPRLGFAWDVTGKGKTVLRAGMGVMYEIPHFDTFIGQFNFNNDPGTIGLNIVPSAGIGIGPGGANGTGTINAGVQRVNPGPNLAWVDGTTPVFSVPSIDCTALPCDTFSVKRNLRTPYVTSWNLNLQEAITQNLALQVGYVGNHGTKIFSVYDINQVNQALDDGGEQLGRPFNATFPGLGFINQLGNGYESNYNSLQTTLTERTSRGLSFILGYTYSHALDQGSDNRAPQASNSLNPRGEYGSSDFDIKHRLTFSMTYAIPGKKSVGQLLEGWQLNSIVTLQTGQPWNVVDTGSDTSLTGESGDRWNFAGNPSDFKAVRGGIPYFLSGAPDPSDPLGPTDPAFAINNPACVAQESIGQLQNFGCYQEGNSVMTPPEFGTWGNMRRNMFRGPALKTWDMSIVKNWKLGERLTAQIRGEFFNLLNHPNFANPYGVNFTFAHSDPSAPGSFGCACATPDVADANPVIGTGGPRNIQLGLKLSF